MNNAADSEFQKKNQNSTNLYPGYKPVENWQSQLRDVFAEYCGEAGYSNSDCSQ